MTTTTPTINSIIDSLNAAASEEEAIAIIEEIYGWHVRRDLAEDGPRWAVSPTVDGEATWIEWSPVGGWGTLPEAASMGELTDDEWKAALKARREQVATAPYEAVDSDTIGDKYTHASWGMCARDGWPRGLARPEGRPYAGDLRSQQNHHRCPMDGRRRPGLLGWKWGCARACRVFRGEVTARHRKRALALYDDVLRREAFDD
jgi:hypothetical protein